MAQFIQAYESKGTDQPQLVNLDYVARAIPMRSFRGHDLLSLQDAEGRVLGYTEQHALDHLIVAGHQPRDRDGEQQAGGLNDDR